MLDITYFSLIHAGIPIEDIKTPAGRLWQYGVLNNCNEIEGVTAALWGRDLLDSCLVVLIIGQL